MADYSAAGTGFQEPGRPGREAADPGRPLRLYRWEDAPPALQALSDHGGGEVLVCVAPAAWLDEAWLHRLPEAVGLLLAADTVHDWPQIERTWGAVQRVALDDGSVCVLVARP